MLVVAILGAHRSVSTIQLPMRVRGATTMAQRICPQRISRRAAADGLGCLPKPHVVSKQPPLMSEQPRYSPSLKCVQGVVVKCDAASTVDEPTALVSADQQIRIDVEQFELIRSTVDQRMSYYSIQLA